MGFIVTVVDLGDDARLSVVHPLLPLCARSSTSYRGVSISCQLRSEDDIDMDKDVK